MSQAWLKFHGALNDFLPPAQRGTTLHLNFDREASVKDMIESLGIPHTEIGAIRIDDRPVDFSWRVQDGNHIDITPIAAVRNDPNLPRLRPDQPDPPRFVADVNLGRLAKYLRMLGFDTRYTNDCDDATLASIAAQQQRILLTRDRTLLQRKIIDHGYFVRSDQPREQVREIIKRYHLPSQIKPFSRCIRCNGLLQPIAKETIIDRLEPKTRRYYNDFLICRNCGQIYWKGSHYQRAMALIEAFLKPG